MRRRFDEKLEERRTVDLPLEDGSYDHRETSEDESEGHSVHGREGDCTKKKKKGRSEGQPSFLTFAPIERLARAHITKKKSCSLLRRARKG